MCQSSSGVSRKQKWYNANIFPLIPVLEIKKADQHNTSGFSFRWLFFTIWSLDSFSFEIALVCTTHWGLGFIGILPYLRWVVCVPCPESFGIWIHKKLNRNKNL